MAKILIPSRRVWTRQPKSPTALNRTNTFGRAVLTGCSGGLGKYVSVSKEAISVPLGGVSNGNTSILFSGAVNGHRLDYGIRQPRGAFAVVAKFRKQSNHSNNCPIFDNKLVADWDNSPGFTLNVRGDNGVLLKVGTSETYTASGAFSDAKYHLVTAIYIPGVSQDFYVDGVKPSYSESSIASSYISVSRSLITASYYDLSGIRSGASEIEYAYLLDGIWTPDALEKLHDNPWQIFQPREQQTFYSIGGGGLASVYGDNAVAYAIREMLSSDSGIEYAIRNAIYRDDAVGYALRAAISANSAVGYVLRQAIAKDDLESYLIRGIAQSDDAEAYKIRGLVQTSDNETYSIRSSVQASVSTAYDVMSSATVAANNAVSYAVRGMASSDAVTGYTLRSAVAASESSAYSVRSAVSRDAVAGYEIAAAESSVYADSTVAYSVDGVAPSCPSAESIAAAVVSALQGTTIPANIKQVNDVTVQGAGTKLNPWQPV